MFQKEETRLFNLISYLAFLVGEVDTAFKYNERVLNMQKHDAIALANRLRFRCYSGSFYDSKKDIETLQRIYHSDEGRNITVNAKCELAWSYAQLGPKSHELSISRFKELGEDARFHLDKNTYYLWKFEYGLCLRRTLHLENRVEYPEMDEVATTTSACQVFVDVAKHAPNRIYQARAWANLGVLAFHIDKRPLTFGFDIKKYISVHQSSRVCKDYFLMAKFLDETDFDVLELCGKYYRYFGELRKAIDFLGRALLVGVSSLAYHHLALTLKKLEQEKIYPYSRNKSNHCGNEYLIEKTSLTKMINSPRRAFVLKRNEETELVLHFLDKAIEIDPGNKFAVKDKAFTYRQLQDLETAKDIFCRLANSLEVCELKVTCYEQAGYCCLDLAAKFQGHDKQRFEHDAFCNLKKAIEVAATLAAKVNGSSTEVRRLLPTVHEMLSDPSLIISYNNELERLKSLLEENGNFLPIIRKVKSDVSKNVNFLIDKCQKEGCYYDAGFLAILDQIDERDTDMFLSNMKVLLDTASTALSIGTYSESAHWYQRFFDIWAGRRFGQDRHFDVF